MAGWFARVVATVVLSVSVVGCQGSLVPSVSPTPSFRCTPEAGGEEFDCTEFQHWEMVRKDKLYAEAEAVYRKYLAEDFRVATSQAEVPTPVLLETTADAFLADALARYKKDRSEGVSFKGGRRELKTLQRLPGMSKGGSVVAIRACVDARSVKVLRNGERIGNGLVTTDDLYLGRFDATLKIIGADGKQVKSCASA